MTWPFMVRVPSLQAQIIMRLRDELIFLLCLPDMGHFDDLMVSKPGHARVGGAKEYLTAAQDQQQQLLPSHLNGRKGSSTATPPPPPLEMEGGGGATNSAVLDFCTLRRGPGNGVSASQRRAVQFADQPQVRWFCPVELVLPETQCLSNNGIIMIGKHILSSHYIMAHGYWMI